MRRASAKGEKEEAGRRRLQPKSWPEEDRSQRAGQQRAFMFDIDIDEATSMGAAAQR
jgi:hypothetical protein